MILWTLQGFGYLVDMRDRSYVCRCNVVKSFAINGYRRVAFVKCGSSWRVMLSADTHFVDWEFGLAECISK